MRKEYSISYGKLCEIGDKKPTNQDCILAKHGYINNSLVGLFIVADGVGGLADGDVISNIIAMHFERWFDHLPSSGMTAGTYIHAIDKEIAVVNEMAYNYSQSENRKMGSTIALLFIVDNAYYVRNIGDSRVYIVDKKCNMHQLSYDHSFVAELVRTGKITESDALVHPKKNVLYSCVGVKPEVEVYPYANIMDQKENIFIVCSDGFYNYADGNKVYHILKNKKLNEQEKAEQLRLCIPEGNAKDNVSVLLIKVSARNKFI